MVTDSGDDKVWASDDCVNGAGSELFQVPGKATVTGSVGGAGAVGGGSSGSGGGGGGTARQVPAGSSLPVCAPGQLKLTVHSLKNTYAPGEKPQVVISVENTADSTCKADLGPKGAVLVVTDSGDDKVWASDDCVNGAGSELFQVPGKATVTR
ncbi:hypothetical protein ACJA3G_38250, partial [Streptomyces sp. YS-3]